MWDSDQRAQQMDSADDMTESSDQHHEIKHTEQETENLNAAACVLGFCFF